MLWRMSADLPRQGIGMTIISIDASGAAPRASSAACTMRSVGCEMTGGKGGKGANPLPGPYSGTKEFSVFPAKIVSCCSGAGH
jgi:hypothetical protein